MDKTLLKGLSLLEILADATERGLSLDELAQKSGLTRSNAHRTVQTLIHAGYAERMQNGSAYRCTLKLFSVGLTQFTQLDIRRIAPAYMATLAREIGETIHLSILDGTEVIYLDKIDSVHPIGPYSTIGGRAPAHAVATGKALLCVAAPSLLESLPKTLPRFTAATITDKDNLVAELAEAARLGYAVNEGEWRQGVGGLASPIFDAFDNAVAAVGISGPLDRLPVERMKQFAPLVVEVCAALSRAFGHTTKAF